MKGGILLEGLGWLLENGGGLLEDSRSLFEDLVRLLELSGGGWNRLRFLRIIGELL